MVAATRETLGIGIYTPEEAAFYARISTQLMNRWLFGDKKGAAIVRPQLGIDQPRDERTVTFLDMIQALAIRDIRNSFNLPLQKIRAAVDFVRDRYHIEHPFAMKHTTVLVSDKKRDGHGELVIRLPQIPDIEQEMYVQVSGKAQGNILIRQAVEAYMDELEYTPEGIASEYRPMTIADETILLNPHLRFGEPVVESCGYTAESLWEAAIAEGGIEAAAQAYGVPEGVVRLAYKYFDYLKPNAA